MLVFFSFASQSRMVPHQSIQRSYVVRDFCTAGSDRDRKPTDSPASYGLPINRLIDPIQFNRSIPKMCRPRGVGSSGFRSICCVEMLVAFQLFPRFGLWQGMEESVAF
jgi:hypothetical protein